MPMKNYKRLLIYIKPYLKRLGLAIICIVFAAAANLYVPWIIKDMIDQVLAEKNMELLNLIAIGIVVVFFFRGIFYFGQSYLVAYIGQRVIIPTHADGVLRQASDRRDDELHHKRR